MQTENAYRGSLDAAGSVPYSHVPGPLQSWDSDNRAPRSYGAGEVLVRVHATAARTQAQRQPSDKGGAATTAESDIYLSGTVEPISSDYHSGESTQSLRPGTEVFGVASSQHGAVSSSSFVVTDPSGLAVKPRNLSRAESAAVAMGGLQAWQALFVKAGIPEPDLDALAASGIASVQPQQRHKRMLVTEAAGETGIYLVQLAALAGVHVVAVCGSRAQDEAFLMSLGASEVLEREDLQSEARFFDYILNNSSDEDVLSQCWLLVANDGTFISLHPDTSGFAKNRPTSRKHVNAQFHHAKPSTENLTQLSRTLELGFIRAFVAETVSVQDGEAIYKNTSSKSNRRGSVILANL